MSLADGMKNGETRYSRGYCGVCNKETYAKWERIGNRLNVFCEECGSISINDENRFKGKIQEDMSCFQY